jgi:hypothetical protein
MDTIGQAAVIDLYMRSSSSLSLRIELTRYLLLAGIIFIAPVRRSYWFDPNRKKIRSAIAIK